MLTFRSFNPDICRQCSTKVIYNFRELPTILFATIYFYRTGPWNEVCWYDHYAPHFSWSFQLRLEKLRSRDRTRVVIQFPKCAIFPNFIVRIIRRSLRYSYHALFPSEYLRNKLHILAFDIFIMIRRTGNGWFADHLRLLVRYLILRIGPVLFPGSRNDSGAESDGETKFKFKIVSCARM